MHSGSVAPPQPEFGGTVGRRADLRRQDGASKMTEAKAILVVSNLTVSYNGTVALEGVSFEVHAGERVAIVGPNGSGKSTLFKVLAGLLQPRSGRVAANGAEIGYVTQRSTMAMMGRIAKMGWLRWQRPVDREIVNRCLVQVGMSGHAHRQIGELSGGQQQRVFIARALAQEATIVLMDEPFSGVDAPSREAILEILDRLRQEMVTVLVSTHDLNLAVERFDRIALLNRELVAYGTPRQVVTSQALASAYGGHALWRGEDYALLLGDIDCCGEGSHNHG